jgi:adenylate kinase
MNSPQAGTKSRDSEAKPARQLPPHSDLEIKDAALIFPSVWADLEQERGRENLRFPKEIILLGGAPGSGKGTNTPFIMQARGLTCPPIVVSALLDSPEAQRIKDAGAMVGDREVVGILLRKLLEPEYADGAVIDGFPRTKVQVEVLKALVNKLNELRQEFGPTPIGNHFRNPVIHIMVLFVSERVSVERQLKRGREVKAHNEEVRRTGIGELQEERVTDFDQSLAERRYRVFKEQTWEALTSLKQSFHYHFVDAEGTLGEVERNILRELQYQSSLELDPRTFDRLRGLSLASEIVVHARQELVKRLDCYELEHTPLFSRVVEFVERKVMPIVKRQAISGMAMINTEDALFDSPLTIAMLIDVFSERGFTAVVDINKTDVPEKVDLRTGEIYCRQKKVIRIRVQFKGSEIRRGG